jgi:hypothetical protein
MPALIRVATRYWKPALLLLLKRGCIEPIELVPVPGAIP